MNKIKPSPAGIGLELASERELTHGRFVSRDKKFLVRAQVGGRQITGFLSHTGKLSGLLRQGSVLLLWKVRPSPKRRLPYHVVGVLDSGVWVCLKPQYAIDIAALAASRGLLPGLPKESEPRREWRLPNGERTDLAFFAGGTLTCAIEVKSCCVKRGRSAMFPDTLTERGTRQVRTLARLARSGLDVRLCFVAMRQDVTAISIASGVDPMFAREVDEAARQGVRVMGLRARLERNRLALDGPLPVYYPHTSKARKNTSTGPPRDFLNPS